MQGDALDLHSSSTTPSLVKRRGSQETGSKETNPIKNHDRGTTQYTIGQREKTRVPVEYGKIGNRGSRKTHLKVFFFHNIYFFLFKY